MAKDNTNKEQKRRPLVADIFMHRKWASREQLLHPKAIDQIQRATRKAHKFVLDEDAARRIAKVVLEVPELLVREHQFARAPYDVTWIEFPAYAYWQTLRDDKPASYDRQGVWGQSDTGDHTVGYLIDHGRVNTIVRGTVSEPDADIAISPLQYQLNTQWTFPDQVAFAQLARTSRLELAASMWGSTFDNLNENERYLLRNNNVMEMVPLNPNNPLSRKVPETFYETLRGSTGDVRTIIAILLMLNRPSITKYREVASGRGFVRGKSMPYVSHSVVEVSFDAAQTLRNIGTPHENHIEKRRHEVRGHYCHDETAREYSRLAGCIHNFEPHNEEWTPWHDAPPDEVNHWVCSECGGRRWWRKSHHRGSALVGYVLKDGYDVTSE